MRRKGGDTAKTPRFYPEDTKNLTQSPDADCSRKGRQGREGGIFDYVPKLWGARILDC